MKLTFKNIILLLLGLVFITPAFAAISPLDFTVNLSETVIVDTTSGTPTVPITIGATTKAATYTSGSGSNTLVFTYTPVAGDVDLDGIEISSPIALNGGTIKDSAGNDIVVPVTFTVPVTTGIKINYPSLALDFINDRYTVGTTVYNSLATLLSGTSGVFGRSSIATYYDSAGILQTASANAARFDYDPVTLAAKGILIEESRINGLTYSDQIDNAAWTKQNITITANSLVAPSGSTTADTWTRNSTASSYFGQGYTKAAAAQTYTGTIYAKKNIGNYFALRLQGLYPGRADIVANLNTGTISTAASTTAGFASATGSIQNVGNGWYRIILSATSDTDTNIRLYGSFNSNGVTLDGTDTASNSSGYVWGAQLERGSFATSYIPTTTAAVTRSAESLTIPTGAWFSGTESTLYGYGSTMGINAASTFADINNNNWTERFQLRLQSGFTHGAIITTGNVLQAGLSGGSTTANTFVKMALAAKSNDAVLYAGGTLRNTDNSLSMPTGQTQIRIGGVSNGAEYLNGYLQSIRYYPKRIDNTQLQLMTQ